MSKEDFKTLFEHALEVAAQNAERKLGRPVPRRFEIETHGLAPHPRVLKKDDAFEEIYLGPDRFYRIIDLAVRRVSKDVCTVFMGISGHTPGPLSQTWNQPPGSGPFKQVLADEVKVT
jgi:hypothetical protein